MIKKDKKKQGKMKNIITHNHMFVIKWYIKLYMNKHYT